MHFAELHLNDTLLAAVAAEGYTVPTAIQQKAIPEVLTGRDLVGLAQTGTGKTAAFALPILHRLMLHPSHGPRHIRVLVLAPTRELASQIGQSFATYGRGAHQRETVIFGGVGQDKQTRSLRDGVDILVATPGRLLDLMGQGFVDFRRLEVLVLDEADRMLDMGFIHDVRRIVQAIPAKRQTLLFSATMPSEVKQLAASLLTNPARVEVHPLSSTAERIDQSVYLVERSRKRPLLQHLLSDPGVRRALVFTRTKQGANRVAEFLTKVNIHAEAIHGNKSQGARERALAHFVSGETRVLVATDIAARGIDIEDISHIVNFELPNVPETYVHRIGRTARAGATGVALSFCDTEEQPYLVDIEKLTRQQIPRIPIPANLPQPPPESRPQHAPGRPGGHTHAPRPSAPTPPREGHQRAQSPERQPQHGAHTPAHSSARPHQGGHANQQQQRPPQPPRSPNRDHDRSAPGEQRRGHPQGDRAQGNGSQATPHGGSRRRWGGNRNRHGGR